MKVLLMGEWRQIAGSSEITLESHPSTIRKLLNAMEEKYPCGKWGTAMVALNHTMYAGDSVSYTHLTLPTKRIV